MNQNNIHPIWLTDAEVQDLLPHEDAYAAVVQSLVCHAHDKYVQPLKPYIRPKGREQEYEGGRFIAMPAYVGGEVEAVGIKWIAGFPANINKGLPRASGLVALNSTNTGQLIALMPCETLSARRTGAVAALSVNNLAPTEKRLAVIGAGPIGQAVLESIDANVTSDIAEVRLCDLRQERAEQIVSSIERKRLPDIQVHTDPEKCVEKMTTIITATTGSTEYLRREWIREKGWLYIGLSLDDCEPEVMLSADRIIVDDFDQCCREQKLIHRLLESGRLQRERIDSTLGQILYGTASGRKHEDETIYVNPMGMAIEDIAVAQLVFRKAVEKNVGLILPS